MPGAVTGGESSYGVQSNALNKSFHVGGSREAMALSHRYAGVDMEFIPKYSREILCTREPSSQQSPLSPHGI
jgi:hypothetical protein